MWVGIGHWLVIRVEQSLDCYSAALYGIFHSCGRFFALLGQQGLDPIVVIADIKPPDCRIDFFSRDRHVLECADRLLYLYQDLTRCIRNLVNLLRDLSWV